ncbi:MAG: ABC transporter ATP-binding protein [Treponema sp.]|jgi:iron(III) transport system ATP-binding protein|nr:ABC transporter ATP-binding protein [Treponema sp.]
MLVIKDLYKYFGDVRAVDHVSLELGEGEMLCLLGPSGCGKTTLLMILSGFLEPDGGSIIMDNTDVTRLPPNKRPTSLVFQNYALFPHLSVFENIAFGLRVKKLPLPEIRAGVERMLKVVGLEGMEGRSIFQLSGGQQQRVALARALVMKPRLLLLDEPLSNLDAKLRIETREQIRAIQRSVGITAIFVTHDQEEALTMADKIAVMRKGVIEQHTDPVTIYHQPKNEFVAGFIGKSNFLQGTWKAADGVFVLTSGIPVRVGNRPGETARTGESPAYSLVIRPEYFRVAPPGKGGELSDNCLRARVETVTFLGELTEYVVDIGADGRLRLTAYGHERIYREGEELDVHWPKTVGTLLYG